MRASKKMQGCWYALLSLFFSVWNGLGLNIFNKCNTDLGLEDLKIPDPQLTAWSYIESLSLLSLGHCKAVEAHPRCARLNNNVCSWCGQDVNGQYLQVDLGNCVVLSGVETQGAEGCMGDYYVRKYKVSYSTDGQTWTFYPLVMRGNHDGRSRARRNFNPLVYARYIRIHPTAYSKKICLRMELYECSNSSCALSTTPSPTTLSGTKFNYTTPENVTRVTTASSREKTMIIQSTADLQPVGSDKVLKTTPRGKETLPSEKHNQQTGNVTKKMANDDSKTWFITFVLIFFFFLLVWFICFRKRTRSEIKRLVKKRQQPNGS